MGGRRSRGATVAGRVLRGRGATVRRWLLWLTIGALLLFEAGAIVTTGDGKLLLPPGVLTGALLFWLFVTAAVVKRRFIRTGRDPGRNPVPRRPERLCCVPLLLAAGLCGYAAPAAGQAPLIAMAGAALPALDGRGFSALRRDEPGAASSHEPFHGHRKHTLDAERSGPWKRVFPRPGRDESSWRISKTGAFVDERLEPVTGLDLYNLETDLDVRRNVAAEHPEVVERLTAPRRPGAGRAGRPQPHRRRRAVLRVRTEAAAPATVDHAVTRPSPPLRFLAGLDADLRQSLLSQIRDTWTHNSTALEGNSLSLGDTKFVIEEGLTVAGKPVKDHQEVIGHAGAITQIYGLLGRDVTDDDLFNLHRSVQAERVVDVYKPLGSWKVEPNGTYAVDDSGVQVFVEYAAPEDVPALMAEVIDGVNATRLRPDDAGEAAPAYARIHAGFVSIHPFWDGNGRLARLIANVPLLNAGLPPLVIPKEERRLYIDTLARYQRRVGRIHTGDRRLAESARVRAVHGLLPALLRDDTPAR